MYEKCPSTRRRSSGAYARYADHATFAPLARSRSAAAGSVAGASADRITQSASAAASACTAGTTAGERHRHARWVAHASRAAPTSSPRSSARFISNASRSAVNGRSGVRPSGASTRLPPTPRPCHTRPGASSASVAIAAAVATGWRENGLVIAGATIMRSVPSTTAVNVTYRSRSVPSSARKQTSAPSCSASRASSTMRATGCTGSNHTPHGKPTDAL